MKKKCPECGFENGLRAYNCKKCNSEFVVKKKPQNINWRDLVKGDVIKVGGGPYFKSESSEGEIVYMGYKGKYTVDKLDEKGILAWGLERGAGMAYIYMGPEVFVKDTGLYKQQHKISKVRTKNSKRNAEESTT